MRHGCLDADAAAAVRGEVEGEHLVRERNLHDIGAGVLEVGIEAARRSRVGVVLLGVHLARDERVAAVRTDNYARPLGDRIARSVAADDAGHGARGVACDLLDGEAFAHLGARFASSVDERGIEDGAPRGHRQEFTRGRGEARAEGVQHHGRRLGRARIDQPLADAPLFEADHRVGLEEVRGKHVARERVAVHHKDLQPGLGQQHPGR